MARRTPTPKIEGQFDLFSQPAEMVSAPAPTAPTRDLSAELAPKQPEPVIEDTKDVGATALRATVVEEKPKAAQKSHKSRGSWRRKKAEHAPRKVEMPEIENLDTKAYEQGTDARRWRDANFNDRLPALLQSAEMLDDENRQAYEIWEDRTSSPVDKQGNPVLNKYQKFQDRAYKQFVRSEEERTGVRPDARAVQSHVGEKVHELQRKAYAYQDQLNVFEHYRRSYWSAWWQIMNPSGNFGTEDIKAAMCTTWYSNALKIEEGIKPGVYRIQPGTGVKHKALPGTGDEHFYDFDSRKEYIVNPLMGGADSAPKNGSYKHTKSVYYEKADFRKEPRVVTAEQAQSMRARLAREKSEYEKNTAKFDQMRLKDIPAQPARIKSSTSVVIRNVVGEHPKLKRKFNVERSKPKSHRVMPSIKKRGLDFSARGGAPISLRRKYGANVSEKDLGESA